MILDMEFFKMIIKPTLAFIDSSYHKRTKSTIFLREILKKDFDIVDIWDESWNGGKSVSSELLNKQRFEYVLFFQDLPSIAELRNIKARIVWVPMYDSGVWWPDTTWQLLSTLPIKIISFSKAMSNKIAKFGFEVLDVQIYLDPAKFSLCKKNKSARIFFWQRGNFDFNKLNKFLDPKQISKVILKIDPDPGYKTYYPDKKTINDYKIEIFKGDMKRELLLEKMKDCNVYVAPRFYEGIGWSFIEAMSMGMAVIAINNATMNEYIDSSSGYLINLNRTKPIDLAKANEHGINARKKCMKGWKKWEEDKRKITPFIKSVYKDFNHEKLEKDFLFRIKNLLESRIANMRFNFYKRI